MAGSDAGVIPYLSFAGQARAALVFYEQAFAATDTATMPDQADPDRLMHGQTLINGGMVMVCDQAGADAPTGSPLPHGHLQLVVADGARWWQRAIDAGCQVVVPYARQFWGDDWGLLVDPYGIRWGVLQTGAAATA
ncbi:MAG: glyoxalase/bleomycin resistance/extradiol dioxygenase family protein [Alphaproteobacteria bacterium]|nr:glyoxalase/bleomycin resistance/extradiol dioxygenase family protein [Alphaproteobacteria bacterium]